MSGRWPANVILSPEMAEVLDGQSGTLKSGGYPAEGGQRPHAATYGKPNARGEARFGASEGGASRYFLNAGYEPWELEWILANGLRPCGM